MRLPTAAHQHSSSGEDAEAVTRAVLGLTAGVGGLGAAIAVAGGQLPLIAIPTLVLLAALVGGFTVAAAYGAAGVWLSLLPAAQNEALVAPLAMIVICVAIAVGPDRLMSWASRDALSPPDVPPSNVPPDGPVEPDGWIEDVSPPSARYEP